MSKPNIYSKFIELKDEILKHKWIESEKVGKAALLAAIERAVFPISPPP